MICSLSKIGVAGAVAAWALAITAPAGAADIPRTPNDRPNHGVGAVTLTAGPQSATGSSTAVTRPDDRAGTRGPGVHTSATTGIAASPGFDWGDAGIGAVGGVGLAIVLGGAVLLLATRRPQRSIAR